MFNDSKIAGGGSKSFNEACTQVEGRAKHQFDKERRC
jgi:hypothetical protein